jgi:DNA-binding GntR family transcriptional regulator
MKPMPDRENLADRVYNSLRSAIILGELVPGSLHSVQELAAQINVSRTPVREALLKLADQGMVRFERNRGIRILQTTIHDLEEIFSLRLLLEVPATYRATQNAGPADVKKLSQALDALEDVAESTNHREHLECDARFHRVILQASGNSRLAQFIDTLRDLQMVRGVSTAGKTRDLRAIYDDHALIHERFAARDAKGAALAMRDHIALTARLLLAQETGETDHAQKYDLPWLDVIGLVADDTPGRLPVI